MPDGIWNDEETLLVIVLMKLRDEEDDEVLYNERLPAMYKDFRDFILRSKSQLVVRERSEKSIKGKASSIRKKEPFHGRSESSESDEE